MPDDALTFFAPTDEETRSFARSLAKIVQPGDLLLLEGGLGAGKTTLARALIRTLLCQPDLEVPSPTYLLVLPYEGEEKGKRTVVLHADLYRLGGDEELEELGLFDDPDAIVLVEWPERAPQIREQAAFVVSLNIAPHAQGRNISLRSPKGRHSLLKLSEKPGDRE